MASHVQHSLIYLICCQELELYVNNLGTFSPGI